MKAFISYDEKNRIKTSPELTASSHRSTEYHIATENLSESEILEGLKLGKDPVLAHVYNLYVEDLFRFGFQYTPSEEIIADSIHDVFLVLITKKQLLENIQSLKAYLFTALSRQIIHSLKRRKLLDQKVAEMEAFKISFQVESRMITEEIHQERLLKVKDAITKLSKKQRQAILLYYSDGFTHQEIAMIMGFRHTNSAAKLIARGIREIRKYVTSTTILVMFTLMSELLNSSYK